MSSLIEFSEEHFPTMLKLLQHELPRSAMLYNVLRLKLSLEKTNDINIRLFGFEEMENPQIREFVFITALIRVQGLPQNLIVVFGPSNSSLQMMESLEKFIDWSQMNQFEGIESSIAEFLSKAGKKHGKVILHDPIELYFLDKSKSLIYEEMLEKFEGITVTQLNPSDAQKINDRWPAACPGSLEMITASIKAIGSGGVYVQDNNGDTELVSWAVALPFGSIHALHTEQFYKKRGFAGRTMHEISKFITQTGRIPVVQIYKKNDTSKSVNQKVGFVYSHDINLIHYYPQ